MKRPSWDEYFIEIMHVVRTRSTCDRGQAGSIIVKDRRLLATGYSGSPSGLPHCDEAGHLIKKTTHQDGTVTEHCLRTIHAEMNAILQAAKFGTQLGGSTIYVSMTPCLNCAKAIIQAGITRVVAQKRYHADTDSFTLFEQAGVELVILNSETQAY